MLGVPDAGPEETQMNEFDLVLPTTVDVREVGMRDGLQLEAPVPLAGKLAMLEALVAGERDPRSWRSWPRTTRSA